MSNSGPVFSPARLLTVGVCVWVLAAAYARPARAEAPLEIELQYTTDPSLPDCPSELAFRAMIVEQLGYDPVRPTSAHRVVAQAQAAPGMISGSVRWRHGESSVGGEREISGKTCKELARAMAFAVTVQIQLLVLQKEQLQVNEAPASVEAATDEPLPQTTDAPLAVAVTEEPPSRSPPPEVAPVAPPTQLQPAKHLATDPTSVWTSALGVGVGVRLRRKPTTTAEGRVFGALFHGMWGGELSLGGTRPQHQDAPDDTGFRFWSVWGAAFGCVVPKPLLGCVGARVERLSARGTGLDAPRLAHTWVVDVGPRVAVAVDLTSYLRTALYAEARVVLAPAWVVVNDTQAWKSPPWSLTLGADVAAIWQ